MRSGQCKGRAITNDPKIGGAIVIIKGPEESQHDHPPNQEQCSADIVKRLKRKAETHPELPPSQVLCTELGGVPSAVFRQLLEQEALARTMSRVQRKDLPAASTSLTDLLDVPQRYKRTLLGEAFLMYDSRESQASSSEDEEEGEEGERRDRPDRVLVFGTRRNVEMLCESGTWFLDGTFKVAPTIFAQVFTILGLRKRLGKDDEKPVPLVFGRYGRRSTI